MSASDTPRSDDAELLVPGVLAGSVQAVVPSAVARTIERESAAKDATIARLRKALCRVVTHAECDHDGMTYQELADMAAAALTQE